MHNTVLASILNMGEPSYWVGLICSLPAIIIALSFHEFAHAYVAHKHGDDTALMLGRMTLNPFAHIDPIGFVMLLIVGFGWAKPVPVNPRNYTGNKRAADIAVSLAGIAMNLLLALLFMLIFYMTYYVFHVTNWIILSMLNACVTINIALAIFNLIPVPPLDGSHLLEDLLVRYTGSRPFIWLRNNSMFVLIAVLLLLNSTGILSTVIGWVYNGLSMLFNMLFGVG